MPDTKITVLSDDTVQPSATKMFNSEGLSCSTAPTYSLQQIQQPFIELFGFQSCQRITMQAPFYLKRCWRIPRDPGHRASIVDCYMISH